MSEIRLSEQPVDIQSHDGVAVLTLQRPAVHNALSADLLVALREALSSPAVEAASAMVISGAGGTFCAGADLSVLRSAVDGDTDAVLGSMIAVLHDIIATLRSLPIPVVAAVEGAAVGAGIGVALAADLRVVGRSAMLVPGYLALGASPDAGVS